jgi:hypothetical protein
MKKHILSLALLVGSLTSFAQITVEKADFAVPGDWFLMTNDYDISATESASLKAGGANKTWSIKGFERQDSDTSFFANGLTFPGAPEGCNLVEYTKDPETGDPLPTYYSIDNNWLKVIVDGTEFGSFGDGIKLMKFPSTMGTSFKDSLVNSITALATDLGFPEIPLFDSAKISFKIKIDAIIDGYGTLQMDAGNFEVLRQKATQQVEVSFKLRNILTGMYMDFPIDGELGGLNEKTEGYLWFSKNSGSFLANAVTDSNGVVTEVGYILASSRGLSSGLKGLVAGGNIASKVYPVPATEQVTIETEVRKSTKADLVVFDILGNKVIEQAGVEMNAGSNQLPVNIQNLKPGVYIYTMEGNGFKTSNKFVVK